MHALIDSLFRTGRRMKRLTRRLTLRNGMDATTRRQLAGIHLRPDRPLFVCDVDEVLVHFIAGFEEWLAERGLYLAPESWSIEGNVRDTRTHAPLPDWRVHRLVQAFFREGVAHLKPLDGAVEALHRLSTDCEIVLLTNLPHRYAPQRRQNMKRLGLPFPLITNQGPKGPAVKALAARTGEACVFIDDHAAFVESVGRHVPTAHLFHFLHDPRFARHAGTPALPHWRVRNWQETERLVRESVNGARRPGATTPPPDDPGRFPGRNGEDPCPNAPSPLRPPRASA